MEGPRRGCSLAGPEEAGQPSQRCVGQVPDSERETRKRATEPKMSLADSTMKGKDRPTQRLPLPTALFPG